MHTTWLPESNISSTVDVAARPDANAYPCVPPSSAATQRSYAKRVGLWLREYSKPWCTPGLDCT